MKIKRKLDIQEDYYSNLPTTQIIAKYTNGKFIDIETDNEVILKEGSSVKISTYLHAIKNEDYKRHVTEIRKEILPKGAILLMRLPIDTTLNYTLTIMLNDPLLMIKKGNKDSVCDLCQCSVIQVYSIKNSNKVPVVIDFEPINEKSLNQIYFQASMQFKKNSKSHTANIYKHTYTLEGKLLDSFRF